MDTDTRVCPKCGYKNIVTSCGFCIECGAGIPIGSSGAVPATSDANTRESRTDDSFAERVASALGQLGFDCDSPDNQWAGTVSVASDRRQRIYVFLSEDAAGQEMISLTAVCGKASAQNALSLLEWNSRLVDCAFAVRSINGEKMFVVTHNLTAANLKESNLATIARQVAERADEVQKKLSGGADRF